MTLLDKMEDSIQEVGYTESHVSLFPVCDLTDGIRRIENYDLDSTDFFREEQGTKIDRWFESSMPRTYQDYKYLEDRGWYVFKRESIIYFVKFGFQYAPCMIRASNKTRRSPGLSGGSLYLIPPDTIEELYRDDLVLIQGIDPKDKIYMNLLENNGDQFQHYHKGCLNGDEQRLGELSMDNIEENYSVLEYNKEVYRKRLHKVNGTSLARSSPEGLMSFKKLSRKVANWSVELSYNMEAYRYVDEKNPRKTKELPKRVRFLQSYERHEDTTKWWNIIGS